MRKTTQPVYSDCPLTTGQTLNSNFDSNVTPTSKQGVWHYIGQPDSHCLHWSERGDIGMKENSAGASKGKIVHAFSHGHILLFHI